MGDGLTFVLTPNVGERVSISYVGSKLPKGYTISNTGAGVKVFCANGLVVATVTFKGSEEAYIAPVDPEEQNRKEVEEFVRVMRQECTSQ